MLKRTDRTTTTLPRRVADIAVEDIKGITDSIVENTDAAMAIVYIHTADGTFKYAATGENDFQARLASKAGDAIRDAMIGEL